jgi:23S rRNA (cytidine1920-2'-O)/16S rRNA (cytidine1409-2'-O)-methyltransferase
MKNKSDARVSILERTNLRTLRTIGELVDLITLDLSFISVLKVMEAVKSLLKPVGHLIVLIKPQFEAGKHEVAKGGIIIDPEVHKKVVDHVVDGIKKYGFVRIGVIESPLLGADGNKEFLAYFKNVPEQ